MPKKINSSKNAIITGDSSSDTILTSPVERTSPTSEERVVMSNTLESSKQLLNYVISSFQNPSFIHLVSNWMNMLLNIDSGSYYSSNRHNQQFIDLIINKEFIETVKSLLTTGWENEECKRNLVFWIFFIAGKHCRQRILPTVANLRDQLRLALPKISTQNGKTFANYSFLLNDFPSIYLEFFWVKGHKLECNLISKELTFLMEKHGDDFGMDYLHLVAKFYADRKTTTQQKDILKNFLTRSENKIKDKKLSIITFSLLYNGGFFNYQDFFNRFTTKKIGENMNLTKRFFKNGKNKNSLEYLQDMFYGKPDIPDDYVTLFLNGINYDENNIPLFINQYPENGYPLDGFKFWFKEFIILDLETLNAIRDKELFIFVLTNAFERYMDVRQQNVQEGAFLSSLHPNPLEFLKEPKRFIHLGFSFSELLNLIPVCPTTYLDHTLNILLSNPPDINMAERDVGTIFFAKYFQNYFPDKVRQCVFGVNAGDLRTNLYIARMQILASLFKGEDLNFVFTGQIPTPIKISELITKHEMRVDNLNIPELTLVNKFKSFKIPFQVGTTKAATIINQTFRLQFFDSEIFTEPQFKLYVLLSNKFFPILQGNDLTRSERLVYEFVEYFKTKYEDCFELLSSHLFNLKITILNACNLLSLKNRGLVSIFLEEILKFLPKEYLSDVEKNAEYRLLLKAARYDESIFSKTAASIKHARDNDPLMEECSSLLEKHSDPEVKELLQKVIKRQKLFHAYEWTAKNPGNFVECPICLECKEAPLILVSSPCGHHICLSCASHSTPNCASCRAVLTGRIPYIQPGSIVEDVLKKMEE